jgi:hypothetical protein
MGSAALARPIASLSLDLDNQWSYMKSHGDDGWQEHPSYFDVVVPRVLDFLAERQLRITFFVVGQDAALDKNRSALDAIARAGHEIGNHSFHHEPWLHLYREDELEAELERSEKAIEQATGRRPIGFRGPGFSLSEATLRVLDRRGYLYDTSTLPTFIGPLARAYYLFISDFDRDEARKRKRLFGGFSEGFRGLNAYRWQLSDSALLELPVTTFPLLRVPIHFSYLIFIATRAPRVARRYFRAAMWSCAHRGIQPTLLLHPLDFVSSDDIASLEFLPAMRLPGERKLELLSDYLEIFREYFDVRSVGELAKSLADRRDLPSVRPRFRDQGP